MQFQSTSVIADGRIPTSTSFSVMEYMFQSTSVIADGRIETVIAGTPAGVVSIHVRHC